MTPQDQRTRSSNIGSYVLTTLIVVMLSLQLISTTVLTGQVRSLRSDIAVIIERGGTFGSAVSEGLPTGQLAPAFTLIDTNNQAVSLSDSEGTRTLLVFTSPECSYCTEMYPELNKFIERYKPSDVTVRVLSLATIAENQHLKSQLGETTIQFLAASTREFADYRVPGTPFFVLVSLDGRVLRGATVGTADQIADFISN